MANKNKAQKRSKKKVNEEVHEPVANCDQSEEVVAKCDHKNIDIKSMIRVIRGQQVMLDDHALESSGKAGRSRWMGRRPHNRGVVMNPHDHPMGGGEGRQSGGHPRSRKGLYAKGLKTRAPKKQSNKYIIERCMTSSTGPDGSSRSA